MNEKQLPERLRAALDTYRTDRSSSAWTALSQMWVTDEVEVLDALQEIDPSFPDPLPLPVEGVVDDNSELIAWSTLPDPDVVLRAIVAALGEYPIV